MIVLQLVFVIGIVWTQATSACNITCTPDDEFVNSETTSEWEDFMKDLTDGTFNPYTLQCFNSDQILSIDYNSDIIWDLRYQIYSGLEEDEQTSKTLNDCYCEFQSEEECKSEEFRQCVKDVRISMKEKVVTLMQKTISNLLFEMALAC